MRITAAKFLMLALALVAAVQPPTAHACSMGEDGHPGMDHSTMQMGLDAGAHSACCDQEISDTHPGCTGLMACGSCMASASMISASLVAETLWSSVPADSAGSGAIQPSHSSPPYHPPSS